MKSRFPTRRVSPSKLRKLCVLLGGQTLAAELLHVNPRTVRRWCAGDRRCPWYAARLLEEIHAEPKYKAALLKMHRAAVSRKKAKK